MATSWTIINFKTNEFNFWKYLATQLENLPQGYWESFKIAHNSAINSIAMMIWLICLSIVASGVNPEKLIFSGTADIEKKTLVQTESGPISGLIFNRNNINVNAYLAVPYAMPPIGDRRFERATLVKPWKSKHQELNFDL